jgi:putative ABC transport system permease protein
MTETLLRDVRFALRTLAKAPSFTAAVVATIALAAGATTAMFAVVDGILLRPLPFPDSGDAFVLCETNPRQVGTFCGGSPMNVADYARTAPSLDSAGVARTEGFIATIGGAVVGVEGAIVSPGFFRVLRTEPMLGRLIEDRDMARGPNQAAVVSHAFWQQRLGGDRGVVGRVVETDNGTLTIVGILKADAYFPGQTFAEIEVWKPLTASFDNVENRAWRGFTAIGRRKPGVSETALSAELETVRAGLAAAYPEANREWGLRIVNLRRQLVDNVDSTLWIFLGAVGFVLLIACANVASLLLVRATNRVPEFAVRSALGAGRGRLAQQLVTESLLLSLAGGTLGVLLAAWATAGFVAVAPPTIPRLDEVGVDGRIILFAFALSTVAALVFGFAPARQASRSDLSRTLTGQRAVAGSHTRLRSAFVVVQLALALVLLFGAGLLTRSFTRLLRWDPGFDRAGVMTTWLSPPHGSESVAAMERVRDEVAAIPGVRGAALGSAGPLFGGTETGQLAIDGRAEADAGAPPVHWMDVSPQYFDTLGIRLVRGRPFADTDVRAAAPVAIVNETFARRFFPGENPIGRRVSVQKHESEIVGIVSDTRPLYPDQPTAPQLFWPIRQFPRGGANLILRTTPGLAGVEKAVRERAASVNAAMQLSPMVTLDERFERNVVSPRFNVLLVAAFAFVAVVLAAVGVYGVLAYALASRTRELGVRIALGATPGRLVGTGFRQGMLLAAVGIAAGGAAALALGRLLTSLLYGLPPTDPLTFGAAVVLLALVAAMACWLPARRAARVDPVVALASE